MAEKQNHKERLKEITDSIETGIMELFESDKYKSYLQTMSRFHKYSLNNTEERNPSLGYKGALIHPLGAVRSGEGILQTAFAMVGCAPQTPCALADKQHSLRRIFSVNKS